MAGCRLDIRRLSCLTLAPLPESQVYESGDLMGTTVAQFVESSTQSVLLVREDWIGRILRKAGLAMVFGCLGEGRPLEKTGATLDSN